MGHRTESLGNWDGPMTIVPCLHQGNIYTKRKLMERPEMYSVSRCNNPTYLCGLSNYPVSREAG